MAGGAQARWGRCCSRHCACGDRAYRFNRGMLIEPLDEHDVPFGMLDSSEDNGLAVWRQAWSPHHKQIGKVRNLAGMLSGGFEIVQCEMTGASVDEIRAAHRGHPAYVDGDAGNRPFVAPVYRHRPEMFVFVKKDPRSVT